MKSASARLMGRFRRQYNGQPVKRVFLLVLLFFGFKQLFAQTEIVPVDRSLNRFLNVRDFTISKDLSEAYFSVQSPAQDISQLARITRIGESWSEPELLSFGDPYMYLEPFLTRDGLRLFFVSDRPLLDSDTAKKDFDIWYLERADQDSDWSSPINLGLPVNSPLDEFYPTLAENNNLYFTVDAPHGLGKDDIYMSEWKDGVYHAPVLLDGNINSSGYEFNAFVSAKEDFILFTKYNEEGGLGSGDLYISRKAPGGEWEKAQNLGAPINTPYMEYCPYYDEDNQVLYFTSRRNSIKPRQFKDLGDFEDYVNGGENGLSKIYQVSFKID